jgi:hypothetical protein
MLGQALSRKSVQKLRLRNDRTRSSTITSNTDNRQNNVATRPGAHTGAPDAEPEWHRRADTREIDFAGMLEPRTDLSNRSPKQSTGCDR